MPVRPKKDLGMGCEYVHVNCSKQNSKTSNDLCSRVDNLNNPVWDVFILLWVNLWYLGRGVTMFFVIIVFPLEQNQTIFPIATCCIGDKTINFCILRRCHMFFWRQNKYIYHF